MVCVAGAGLATQTDHVRVARGVEYVCSLSMKGGRPMSTAENTAIVRRYVEAVWNESNRTLINEVIAPEFIQHTAGVPPGRDGVRLFFRMIDAAFPDARMTIEDMIAEGDRVVWRFSLRATHTGSFQGIPATGRSVTITGMNIVLVADAQVTQARYGPVLALAIWDGEERAPLYLVSNLGDAETAVEWYRQRAQIETFFSDQKSRGFRIEKSHHGNPARLARMLLAACLAYLWMIYSDPT